MGDKKETGVYQNCATQHRKRKKERERENRERENGSKERYDRLHLEQDGREGNGCVSKLRDSTQKEREREREQRKGEKGSKERYDRLHLEQHGEGEGVQEGLLEGTGQKDVGALGGEGELEATQSSMERQLWQRQTDSHSRKYRTL